MVPFGDNSIVVRISSLKLSTCEPKIPQNGGRSIHSCLSQWSRCCHHVNDCPPLRLHMSAVRSDRYVGTGRGDREGDQGINTDRSGR